MKKYLVLILSSILFISACENNNEDVPFPEDLEITSGFVCGWCSGADSLVITSKSFYYESFNPCSSETKDKISDGDISNEDWEELVQNLDFDTFKSIDLNSCNVCADGCDYWIKVRQGNEIHRITYGYRKADSLLFEPALPFIETLNELKAQLISQ